MALTEQSKNSIAFKKLVNKDHRNTSNQWYEELDGGGVNVHSVKVWADAVPAIPPLATTAVVKVYVDGADGALQLIEDISVPNRRGWAAGSVTEPGRLRGWIPPKYGQSYTVKLYEDDGTGLAKGAQIFTTDNMNWFFDYETGYLSIQDTHSYTTPFWIEAYQYVGQSVDDKLSGALTGYWDRGTLGGAFLYPHNIGDKVAIGNNSGASPPAQLQIITVAIGTPSVLVQALAGQTADFQQWANSAGTKVSAIDSFGILDVWDHTVLKQGTGPFLHTFTSGMMGGNIFLGQGCGNFTNSGTDNYGVGSNCLLNLVSGGHNLGIGTQSLKDLTSGTGNIALGGYSLTLLVDGEYNVSIGRSACQGMVSSDYNVAIGSAAMSAVDTSYNVAIGANAGASIKGANNTCIGYNAGANPIVGSGLGSGNVVIGYEAGRMETGSNRLYIANSSTTTPLIFGDFSVPALTVNGTLNTTVRLGLLESVGSTFYTYLQAGNQSSNITYTFPTALPVANNYILASTTTGTLSWQNPNAIGPWSYSGVPNHYVWLTTNGLLSKVGIGSSFPISKLHIVGTNSAAVEGVTNVLTADGTFNTSTGWTVGAGWTIGGGVASHTSGNTASLSGTSTANDINTVYIVHFTVNVTTLGDGFRVTIGGVDTGRTVTASGGVGIAFRGVASGVLAFVPGPLGTFVGTIDNVTIYAITPSTAEIFIQNSNGTVTQSPLEIRSGGAFSYGSYVGYKSGRFVLDGEPVGAVALGPMALEFNAYGYANTAIGAEALRMTVEGENNTAVGRSALNQNISGDDNTAIGAYSMEWATSASRNTTLGVSAGSTLSSGSNNIIIGYMSGLVSSGSNNVIIGATADSPTASNQLNIANTIKGNTSSASVSIRSLANTGIPLKLVGHASQTSSLQEWQNSSDVPLLTVTKDGYLGFLESGASPTYYTYFRAGDQTAASDITYTLPVTQEAGVLTNNGSGVLFWGPALLLWTATSADVNPMEVNHGYITTNNVAQVNLTLPATSQVGDVIKINSSKEGGWRIIQVNADHIICLGDTCSTPGPTGYVEASLGKDSIEMVCVEENKVWDIISVVGDIDFN